MDELIRTIENFIGLSTDDKPTTPPDGSTYLSVDTSEKWIFFNGMWVIDVIPANLAKMALIY